MEIEKLSTQNLSPNGNILIIEDDLDTGEMLQIMAAKAGYGARLVSCRDDAIYALTQNLYDVIVMDYCMTGLTAEDFIGWITKYHPRTEVLLMTAACNPHVIAKKLQVNQWIGKPISYQQLIGSLKVLFGRISISE